MQASQDWASTSPIARWCVHLAHIGMAELLDIELRAAEEARQEHELRLARMGQPVALVVHDAQRLRPRGSVSTRS